MKRKITALCVVVAMLAVAIIGGTLAYFTDTDDAVNVMTMGNVKIEQIEEEWAANGTALQTFTQKKELVPAVPTQLADTEPVPGYPKINSLNNVLDKYVSVKNTGKSDAYVRTFIAFELGSATKADFDAKILYTKNTSDWTWADLGEVTIDGNRYFAVVATHTNALAGGEASLPSLQQVYMASTAVNEDGVMFDGNANGLYEILAFTQGVQAKGFADATSALNEAFGVPTVDTAAGTTTGLPTDWTASDAPAVIPNEFVSNSAELTAVLAKIKTDSSYWNREVVIELAANTYDGEIAIDQYPDHTGALSGNENVTHLIFRAQGDVVFTGNVHLDGNEYSNGGFAKHKATTLFEGVTFDAANSADEEKPEDSVVMYVYSGASNVTFDGCTFKNASHVTLGGSGAYNGVGTVNFTNCDFINGGCLSGYVETLNVTDCTVNNTNCGFINKSKGGTATVENCTVLCGKYAFRTTSEKIHLVAKDSSFTVVEAEGAKNLVYFRGKNESATFTNCVITPGYTTQGVDADSILTIN